jgi:hypothetical protein
LILTTIIQHRKVYFLSTFTMGLREIPWARDDQSTTLAQGTLCPAMRRLPNVGSLNTELVVSLVQLMRPVINMAVSLPGLIKLWESGRTCSMVTHGHSLLKR